MSDSGFKMGPLRQNQTFGNLDRAMQRSDEKG